MPHLNIAIHVNMTVPSDFTIYDLRARWHSTKMASCLCHNMEQRDLGSVNDINVHERVNGPWSHLDINELKMLVELLQEQYGPATIAAVRNHVKVDTIRHKLFMQGQGLQQK